LLKTSKSKPTAGQVRFARKAAKLRAERRKPALSAKLAAANQTHIIDAGLAADSVQHQSDRKHAHGARAPPNRVDLASLHERLTHRCGLLDKHEITAITGTSFVTVWDWMRKGKFPPGITVVGKTKWRASEIADWLGNLPLARLKPSDAPSDQKIEEHESA
jgi:predicted DNA-binding transcriptional regulator AlpA